MYIYIYMVSNVQMVSLIFCPENIDPNWHQYHIILLVLQLIFILEMGQTWSKQCIYIYMSMSMCRKKYIYIFTILWGNKHQCLPFLTHHHSGEIQIKIHHVYHMFTIFFGSKSKNDSINGGRLINFYQFARMQVVRRQSPWIEKACRMRNSGGFCRIFEMFWWKHEENIKETWRKHEENMKKSRISV